MEVQKRKYSPNGEIEVKKQIKTEKNDGKSKETTVDDEEVEEFYAILRRIRVAMKYFEKGNSTSGGNNNDDNIPGIVIPEVQSGEGRTCTDFMEDSKRVVEGVKLKETVEDNTGLDLNADPVTDTKSESD